MSISQNFPNTRPSLNLNFARSKTLDPRITFTRTSTGTYVDESGLIRTAVADEPRFDHDPVTGECLGLLIEEQRENLINYSTYTASNWANVFTDRATITTGIDAPDGTNTAVRLSCNNTGSALLRVNFTGFTPNGIDSYTASFYVRLISGTTATGNQLNCDLHDSTPGTNYLPQLITNQWVRVVVTDIPSNVVKTFFDLLSDNTNDYVLDFWGVQLEKGSFPTSYIPTFGSTATRNPDNVSMEGENFSDWYNQEQGTIFYDQTVFSYPSTAVSPFYTFSDGTVNNRISGFIVPSGSNHRLRIQESGTTTYLVNAVFAADVLNPARVALAFKTNDANCAYNGLIRSLDQSVTIPSVNRLNFGEFNGNLSMSTRIKKFTFWPQRLPDQILQTLTK